MAAKSINKFTNAEILALIDEISILRERINDLDNTLNNPNAPISSTNKTKLKRERENLIREKKRKENTLNLIKTEMDVKKFESEERKKKEEYTQKQLINAEKERFGRNYFARDYISGITDWTATSVGRKKPFNVVGLRMEWVSPGHVEPSGLPGVPTPNKRKTQRLAYGVVGGNKFGGNIKIDVTPKIHDVSLLFKPIGRGEVIMPNVLKFKKRRLY